MKVKCQLMRFKLHIEMTYVNYSVGISWKIYM